MSHRQAGYQAAFTESEDECDPADIPASSDGERGPPVMVALSDFGIVTAPVKVHTLLDTPASPKGGLLCHLSWLPAVGWHQASGQIFSFAKQVRTPLHVLYEETRLAA